MPNQSNEPQQTQNTKISNYLNQFKKRQLVYQLKKWLSNQNQINFDFKYRMNRLTESLLNKQRLMLFIDNYMNTQNLFNNKAHSIRNNKFDKIASNKKFDEQKKTTLYLDESPLDIKIDIIKDCPMSSSMKIIETPIKISHLLILPILINNKAATKIISPNQLKFRNLASARLHLINKEYLILAHKIQAIAPKKVYRIEFPFKIVLTKIIMKVFNAIELEQSPTIVQMQKSLGVIKSKVQNRLNNLNLKVIFER